ncbi:MAG: hypothetical protein GY807_20575 [Gammaproteobacteria bacterium]|nr:hypothetical protein [Gammaproteobacteria bacterium]
MIKDSFTATGTSKVMMVKTANLSISNTFVGTVAVKRKMKDAFQTIESYSSPVEKVIENKGEVEMLIECTAYTSGTIDYEMS